MQQLRNYFTVINYAKVRLAVRIEMILIVYLGLTIKLRARHERRAAHRLYPSGILVTSAFSS